MMKKYLWIPLLGLGLSATAQTGTKTYLLDEAPRYSEETGYGYDLVAPPAKDSKSPFFFSVRVPDGNYKVTVRLGSRKQAGITTVRAESRRLFIESVPTKKKEFIERTFIVNKRNTHIDGNEYAIVRIGTQQWTGANLRTTHYNDGTPITLLEDQEAWAQCENSEEAAYCLYDNDATNSELYGMLYNWHAANTGKLCPEGWHIPSVEEWKTLSDYLGSNAGAMLKSTSGWSDTWGESKPEYQGTDDYGFTALPGGARKWNQFETLGSKGTWWTTDAVPDYPLSASYARLDASDQILSSGSSWGKESGCSIRCLKD